MSNLTIASRATLRKARWHTQLTRTEKGLGHLTRGLQRFVRHRPVIAAAVVLSGIALLWQALGDRT
jgi:hypothetical protein